MIRIMYGTALVDTLHYTVLHYHESGSSQVIHTNAHPNTILNQAHNLILLKNDISISNFVVLRHVLLLLQKALYVYSSDCTAVDLFISNVRQQLRAVNAIFIDKAGKIFLRS